MKLRIEKAVYGGAGLGRMGVDGEAEGARADNERAGSNTRTGKTVFVPYTLPGELVECAITEDRRSFAQARLASVLEAATARVTPECEYVPRCGGCQYQHASYAAQIDMKRAILRETLGRAGVSVDEAALELLTGGPWNYRNRVRLHIRFGDHALCYREAGSHRDVPVEHCSIAMPLLQNAIRAFSDAATACGLEAGLFDEVEFMTNESETSLLLSMWTTRGASATSAFSDLCEALQELLPMLAGGLLFEAESQKGQWRQRSAWGTPELLYVVNARSYRVSAGSFFQVNRFLVPAMVEWVTAGRSGALAWDLFAGVGLFASALAGGFEQVVAVEQAASSVRDLRHNLPRGRVVASGTLEFLKQQQKAKTPELVVVDPPRAGLGKDVTTLLSQIGPPTIIYVSCDPSTLARDVQQLLHSGYLLRKIAMIDLFPQSYHMETMMELVRG